MKLTMVILDCLANGKMRMTHISDCGHLNYKRCKKHVDRLVENDLVGVDDKEYYLAKKGKKALQKYEELEAILKSSEGGE